MNSPSSLPAWNMTPIFPALDAPEFRAQFDSALQQIEKLQTQFDEIGVRNRENAFVDEAFVQNFERVIENLNALSDDLETLGAYIGCFVTTDANNDLAKALESELETRGVVLSQLQPRLIAWIGSSDVETLLQNSQIAREHEGFIRRALEAHKHQMSETEENLAASLSPMGLGGWAKLHSQISARLVIDVQIEGETHRLPMSAIRALASNPKRETRSAAFDAEIKSWQGVAPTMAACLNGIKGFQREVRERRGFVDDVAPTLARNFIDETILSAMQDACVAAFPDFRRYMKAKARALKLEKLSWFDLIAPLEGDEDSWEWPETEQFTIENFGVYSSKMADFANRAFVDEWIDAAPKVGKVGGAYCTQTRPGESRILMNFDGSFNAVSTLAHELGHGYHNLCLEPRTPLQREIPMTLAETASIFCETLIFEGAVAKANPTQKLALLEGALSRNLQVVVDIHSRFLFEKSVFQKRGERDLSEAEFCELMTQAQLETYGEDVAPLHPYMWAVKGHYYGPTFYNYPYTFGLLLALGLYAQYEENPNDFRAKYDDFLSKCGMLDAQTLGEEFGFDFSNRAFWDESLGLIRGQIDEFEKLVAQM